MEDQLNRFITYLYRIVNYDVNRHREWEKERKIQEEREKEAQRLLAERKLEQQRTENLLKLAEDWNKVKYISSFLDEIELTMKEKSILSEEKKDWLSWARNKLRLLDPINKILL